MKAIRSPHPNRRLACTVVICVGSLLHGQQTASASLFHGETVDAIADVLAWIVLIVVPIIFIAVFWMVHILPEKIAHKRGHPQTAAIQCLCLLSLVFAGLLWPLAWLWAYSKPVLYRMAYGTDVDTSLHAEEARKEGAIGETDRAAGHESNPAGGES